ncbi:hypothetical protein CEXT_748321 [Caerostris extrusa]|uniref:Uncharacterized protein n=1 Tax=Caerostris extrusa TaxID=172846 RepID=A0AAV4X7F7_CAEEX|nr:hypothetical protein CEXT_748321 [Caerostris extrusa]
MRCDPSSEGPVARDSTHRQIPEVVFSVSCKRFRTRDEPPRGGSGQASRKVRGARGRETHPVKVVHPARRRTSFSSLNKTLPLEIVLFPEVENRVRYHHQDVMKDVMLDEKQFVSHTNKAHCFEKMQLHQWPSSLF